MEPLRNLTERLEERLKESGHFFYHIAIIALSAGIVLPCPTRSTWSPGALLTFWSFIADEKIFLVSIEIFLAVLLVLFFNYLGKSWTDRRAARMARKAGLLYLNSGVGLLTQRQFRKLKRKAGFAREIMGIFSTGFQTLVDPDGDLHEVIRHCREARIIILNPYGDGMAALPEGCLHRETTLEQYRGQVSKTVLFLKGLQEIHKGIRLKLYNEPPFLKLEILGETLWLRQYHPQRDIKNLPEYAFEHNQNSGSLFLCLSTGNFCSAGPTRPSRNTTLKPMSWSTGTSVET